jgi:hypothetical protein
MDIAIATCAAFPQLSSWDRGVIDALRDLGVEAAPLIWSDPSAPWERAKCVVVQSTWDSHLRPAEFLAWAERVESVTQLHNCSRVLKWNLHKRYLCELQARGVRITPTVWLERGTTVELGTLMRERDWARVVIKPAVSAGANETYVIDERDAEAGQEQVQRLAQVHDLMIQPYLKAFESEGERAYIFFNGVFSHAVHRPPTLKSAARAFQEERAFIPADPAELDFAHEVITALDAPPLYARVDVATNNDTVVRLQELELVEPSLFTSLAPGASARFARAILAHL